jgi:hypothetical protein
MAKFNIFAMKFKSFFVYPFFQEPKQAINLVLGTIPVLCGEGKNGYTFHLVLTEVSNYRAHIFQTVPVTLKSR